MSLQLKGGAIPALVTPFDQKGDISPNAVNKLVEFNISNGVSGLYVTGSTGEGLVMKPEKRKRMAEAAVEASNGRIPVIVHIGTADTETAVELARHAQSCGADAISAVPPFYYRQTWETISKHYLTIADSVSIPMLLYNIPSLTGVSLGAEQLLELMKHPNIIGLKFTDNSMEELLKLTSFKEKEIQVYMGGDAMLLPALTMGARGGIGTFYNVLGKPLSRVIENYRLGKMDQAEKIHHQVCAYIIGIKKFIGIGLQTGMKTILCELGIPCGGVTPPLMELDEEKKRQLIAYLKREGFFEFIS